MKTILVAAALLLVVAIPAGLYFTGNLPFAHADAAESPATLAEGAGVPQYLTLDPPFVVNFQHRGTLRYLQMSLDLMFYDPTVAQKLALRMPAIRNDLILLFSSQEFEDLSTLEGKEALRSNIMATVNKAVGSDPAEADDATIEAVYITNFVMQ